MEDSQPPVLGELHVHFDHSCAQAIGLPHRIDGILDRQRWILAAIWPHSMVADGYRSHPEAQEILGRTALVILIAIEFLAGHRDAAAEAENQRPSHTSDRNLILDAFVFILPSSSEIS